jgi:transcriptional regulator with GAF, ATPase, and Fis domain
VLGAVSDGHTWAEAVMEHLQMLGDIVSTGLQSRQEPENPETAEAARLPVKARAAAPIKSVFPGNRGFEEIIGESPALQAALNRLKEVVNSESNVVLLGETGTGKELFARALHAHGPRKAFPLVSVNCAALPPTLIESELFGHQRGAFTGAIAPRQGRFELAHHGTLFLDEIGDLPMDLQPKLLRVLQEGAFERVGSSQTHAVDVRIVAATHKDLGRAVAEGEFRADLYYRLNVFPIRLPPLRERREDIPALVWSIIRKRQRVLQRHITAVPNDVLEALQRYSWPGNIRELENVVERALIHTSGSTLTLLEGSLEAPEVQPEVGTTLMSVERAHIEEVLQDCRWRINGIGNAAERLGLHPNTLRFRMKKLGIVRREPMRDSRRLRSDHGSQAGDRAS